MFNLSGYDSEAFGFDSVSQNQREGTTSSTQTTEYGVRGTSSQTNLTKDCGSTASPEDLHAQDDILKEYPPPNLNAFLRRVVPGMLEQMEYNDSEIQPNYSEEEEEEGISTSLLQKIVTNVDIESCGDYITSEIRSVSWSSAGKSIAVSIGQMKFGTWCENEGLIRIYTIRRSAGDKLVRSVDISEKNCVTVVKYHPTVAAMLAYATISGEVVICNLGDHTTFNNGAQLSAPAECHGSKPVSALHWADSELANIFLTMQIENTGKRRHATDQILVSAGCDGSINVWKVNSDTKVFENVAFYVLNASKGFQAPYITCFNFAKSSTGVPSSDRVFAVGSKKGMLYICRIKSKLRSADGVVDPVVKKLEKHGTCVLDVAFNSPDHDLFVSISIDSEMRVYDIKQRPPLKVLCLDVAASCVCWLPLGAGARVAVLGLSCGKPLVRLYDINGATSMRSRGLDEAGEGTATAIAIAIISDGYRVAVSDSDCVLRVWDIPARWLRQNPEEMDS